MKRIVALLSLLFLPAIALAQNPSGRSVTWVERTPAAGGQFFRLWGPDNATISYEPKIAIEDNCDNNANGGKLTINASDVLVCADDASTAATGDISDVWNCASGDCEALVAGAADTFNAGGALSTAACKVGTAAPSTCTVGDCFFDSDATAGSNIFGCTATNTWTAQGGSSGSAKYFKDWTANQGFPQGTATFDFRNNHPTIRFDQAVDECAYFEGFLSSGYAGGGLTVLFPWIGQSTTGAVGWLTAFERHADDAFDVDADGFGTEKSLSATTASVNGEKKYSSIAHSNSEIDGLVAGEAYRLRICRDGNGSTVTDDMVGDSELANLVIYEP